MLNRHSHRRLPVTVKPLGTMKSQYIMNLIKLVLQSLNAGKFADSLTKFFLVFVRNLVLGRVSSYGLVGGCKLVDVFNLHNIHAPKKIARPINVAIKAKIYGILHNQSSSIAFDETFSYCSAPKSS